MERYRGIRAGYVFDVPTRDVVYNAMHYIQRSIGMEAPLTFHMARHTFASVILPVGGCPDRNRKRYAGAYQFENDTGNACSGQFRRIRRDMQKIQLQIEHTFTLKIIAYGTQHIQDIVLH